MAEATTGNDLAGVTQNTGIISRISTSISNVRKMTSDPACLLYTSPSPRD